MATFAKRNETWSYTISIVKNGKRMVIRKSGFKTKTEAQKAAAEEERS